MEKELRDRKVILEYVVAAVATVLSLVIFLTFGLLISSNFSNYLKNNTAEFELANKLIKMDYYFRKTLAIFSSETNFVYWITLLARNGSNTIKMNATTYNSTLNLTKTINSNLIQAFGNQDYMNQFNRRRTQSLASFRSAIQNFDSTSIPQSIDLGTFAALFEGRFNATQINNKTLAIIPPITTFDLLGYIRNTVMRGTDTTNFLPTLRTFVTNKTVPFKIAAGPLDLNVTGFIARDILVLMNSYSGVLESSQVSIETMQTMIISLSAKSYKQSFWAWIYSFAIIATLILVSLGLLLKRASSKLITIMILYKFLKPHELSLHKQYYQYVLRRFQEANWSGRSLIEQFVGLYRIKGNAGIFNHLMNKSASEATLRKSKFKATKFVVDAQLKSFKYALMNLLVLGSVLSLFIGLNVYFYNKLLVCLEIEDLYFNNYYRSIDVQNNIAFFQLLNAYGNYIPFNGQLPSVLVSSDPPSKMAEFWTGKYQDLGNYFEPADLSTINTILYGNVCVFATNAFSGIQFNQANFRNFTNFTGGFNSAGLGQFSTINSNMILCNSYAPTQKGLVGFFLSEASVISNKLTTIFSTQKAYLNSSRSTFSQAPTSTYLLSSEWISISFIHDLIIEFLNSNLFTIMDNTLYQLATTINWSINLLLILSGVALALISLLGIWANVHWIKEDFLTCLETLATILPEAYQENFLLKKTYQTTLLD